MCVFFLFIFFFSQVFPNNCKPTELVLQQPTIESLNCPVCVIEHAVIKRRLTAVSSSICVLFADGTKT